MNIVNNEKKLFSLMKNDLSNDYIRIDKSFIPKSHSNNLNRFFIEDDSFWFSRLKIKDGNAIYYFGLDNSQRINVKPDLILTCNEKSSIRFLKNKLAILVKFKNNNSEYINSLTKYFSLRTNKKLKERGLYFIFLGETSNEIFNNIKLVIEHADYELNFNDNYLHINDSIETNSEFVPKPEIKIDPSLNALNRNLKILKIKNYLKNIPFDPSFTERIMEYLFVVDENLDYNLNENNFNIKIPFDDCILIINDLLEEYDENLVLDLENSISTFKQRFINRIDDYFNNIRIPNSLNDYNEIFFTSPIEEIEETNQFKEEEIQDEKVVPDKNIYLNDAQNELYEKYLSLKEIPKIKFLLIPSLGVSQEDLLEIFKKIKLDIYNEIITEEDDMNVIFEEYVKKYISEKKSGELFEYFNEYISSDDFKELIKEFEDLSDEDIDDIKNKVKLDIESNNLSESDIKTRFKIYFSKKSLELRYIRLLSEEFEKRREYKKSGLEFSEIQEIFDEIKTEINNWYQNLSIFDIQLKDIINNKISIKQREIRSETRQEFEKLFPNKKAIKDVLKRRFFKQEEYEKLNNYIYQDIFSLKIRKEHVNEELIFSYMKFIE